MQLRLPLIDTREHRRLRTVTVAGRTYPVVLVTHRRARRYILRLSSDGALRLTVPRGASIAGGLQFAEREAAWIARERLRQGHRAGPWRDGTLVWWRGSQEVLRVASDHVVCGDERIPLDPSATSVREAVESHFVSAARATLPARCLELAEAHGLAVARVSVRNQRSRWGACSARRVITLNWRLVQMAPSVADYVILHELMHLRQPNHSRRFWREVEGVCGWWREAERWLRRHGRDVL